MSFLISLRSKEAGLRQGDFQPALLPLRPVTLHWYSLTIKEKRKLKKGPYSISPFASSKVSCPACRLPVSHLSLQVKDLMNKQCQQYQEMLFRWENFGKDHIPGMVSMAVQDTWGGNVKHFCFCGKKKFWWLASPCSVSPFFLEKICHVEILVFFSSSLSV